MTVRNARRCRRNCPEPLTALTTNQIVPPPVVHTITSESEGTRLWKHVLFGTETCIGMIEGYHSSDMPGNPLEVIKSFVGRLQKIIYEIETNNEGASAEE